MKKSIVLLLFISSNLISHFKLGIENCISQFPIKNRHQAIPVPVGTTGKTDSYFKWYGDDLPWFG